MSVHSRVNTLPRIEFHPRRVAFYRLFHIFHYFIGQQLDNLVMIGCTVQHLRFC